MAFNLSPGELRKKADDELFDRLAGASTGSLARDAVQAEIDRRHFQREKEVADAQLAAANATAKAAWAQVAIVVLTALIAVGTLMTALSH